MSDIRSQRSASFMKWVETKIVTLSLRERSDRFCQKPSRATGSTPDVGSSRIRMSGGWIIATASERRWRTPSGSASGIASMLSVEPLRHVLDTAGDGVGGESKQPRMQFEILPNRQLGIKREG